MIVIWEVKVVHWEETNLTVQVKQCNNILNNDK